MRILVLGHKGMLGSDIMARLADDHELIGKDREDFDISQAESCRSVMEEVDPEVVINCAAYTDVDGAEEHRDLCFAVNARGVENLCRSCEGRNVKIVHISTDYVFDGKKGALYTEDDVPHPLNIYGASKRAGEEILTRWSGAFLLIRTAWMYGKNGKNFVTTVLNKALNERYLRVVDDQLGSPTYTWDLAGAIKLLLEKGVEGVFHITNRGVCSWFDFARKILELARIDGVKIEPIKSSELDRKAIRPSFSGLSSQKFTQVTGKTLRFWQTALDDFLFHDLNLSR
ncbi:MAG: dTDP-4-dehydrorhamnose reductase [Syntrophales bacterium]|nr:dTDP-4-dehydrorhamnose reductase [Syntrophales bacterium]